MRGCQAPHPDTGHEVNQLLLCSAASPRRTLHGTSRRCPWKRTLDDAENHRVRANNKKTDRGISVHSMEHHQRCYCIGSCDCAQRRKGNATSQWTLLWKSLASPSPSSSHLPSTARWRRALCEKSSVSASLHPLPLTLSQGAREQELSQGNVVTSIVTQRRQRERGHHGTRVSRTLQPPPPAAPERPPTAPAASPRSPVHAQQGNPQYSPSSHLQKAAPDGLGRRAQ